MMRRILDIFGAFERDLIRARTRAALAVKRAKGLKFGAWRRMATASTATGSIRR